MKGLLFLLIMMVTFQVHAVEFNEEFITNHSKTNLYLIREKSLSLYQKCLDQFTLIQNHYLANKHILNQDSSDYHIPKTIHFIWLGPDNIPKERILDSWKKQNPDFEILLWTDRPRTLSLSYVIQKDIQQLFPIKMKKELAKAANWGERSNLLRLEILERFGGIYVDVGMECIQPFDKIVNNCTFFAGISEISPMLKEYYVHIPNNIIGSVKDHKIIHKAIDELQKNWDELTQHMRRLGFMDFHPERTYATLLTCVRSYLPLSEAILTTTLDEKDLIFPARFFNYAQEDSQKPVFVKNHSFNPLFPNNNLNKTDTKSSCYHQRLAKKRLNKCCKYSNRFLGLSIFSGLLMVVLVIALINMKTNEM